MNDVVNGASPQVMPTETPVLSERQAAALILCVTTLCMVLLFWSTIRSMVDAWESSRTFAHGFLVVPATGYLVWSYRHKVASLRPSSNAWGLAALFVASSGWVSGYVAELLWLQQAALIAIFIGWVWTIYGHEITRTLSWPLGFLFFLLPVGTSLEPWLQSLTAWLILNGLDFSGLTYGYRDYHITLGSAVWEVAPDCGGLRYLLPGLSLGYAFAALTYRGTFRRILFLTMCGGSLLLANGVRAYGVIVGNHFGLAVGADHRLFSYAIYGLTMPLLFWIALQWKQPDALDAIRATEGTSPFNRRKAVFLSLWGIGLLVLARLAGPIMSI